MTRLLRAAAVAGVLLVLGTLPVYAHSELEESDPADGATISTPYTLTATFSEEFDPERSFIRIIDSNGMRVAEGGMSSDEPLMMLVELPALGSGSYTARWQTVTPDDNGIERGEFTFTVAALATSTPTAPARAGTSEPPVSPFSPTAGPTPLPTPTPPAEGQAAASGNDVLIALALAAVVLLGLGAYLFMRRR
jgi:copper resistance protein C